MELLRFEKKIQIVISDLSTAAEPKEEKVIKKLHRVPDGAEEEMEEAPAAPSLKEKGKLNKYLYCNIFFENYF